MPVVAHADPWIVMLRGEAHANPFDLDMRRVRIVETTGDRWAARAALLADPDVAWVELDHVRPLAGDVLPADPLLRDTRQWGIYNAGPRSAYGGEPRADAHVIEAWRHSRPGRVLVAIGDTGIDPAHPEFRGRVAAAFDATGRGQTADSAGHGTMVAGIIAARVGDGAHFDSLGIAGVCGGDGAGLPECRVLPIHITVGRSNLARASDIARAIVHATDAGARVLNLSVAGGGKSRLERLALYYATIRGCTVVAASGNRGFVDEQIPMYPAAYSTDGLCIQVGASTPYDRRALFSSYGYGIDVIAPGENVWSTWPAYRIGAATWPGYAVGSGTSFAAPFVTGTVALMLAARPELRDRAVQEILRMTAHDVGEPGVDPEHGAGRLDAGAALEMIGPEMGIWHDEIAATAFRPVGTDTLRIAEDGPGDFTSSASDRVAEMVEATATFTIPDSFAADAHVWPRVGGTFTLAPGHRLPYFAPWARAERIGRRTVRLVGYVYRTDSTWIPLPPDQIRFGFTVLGRVKHAPSAAPIRMLRVSPNPFRRSLHIEAPTDVRVRILDAAGRAVHEARAGAAGVTWEAAAVPPGVYFVRAGTGDRVSILRVVKLSN